MTPTGADPAEGDVLVVDASVVVAALCDGGQLGGWAAEYLRSHECVAPALLLYEAANVLRKLELARKLSREEATLAYDDLLALPIDPWPFEATTERIWELRRSTTCYDASYVALAELLGAPLLTLDRRLARTKGFRCAIVTPD